MTGPGDVERALGEIDAALVSLALARLDSATAREMEPFRDAFLAASAPLLRENPLGVRRAVDAFVCAKHTLEGRAQRLAPHDGEGNCMVCQGSVPDRAMDCACGGPVHGACWVNYRLRNPDRCLLCRRPHLPDGPAAARVL